MNIPLGHKNFGMLLLKVCISAILFMHSIPGIFNGGIEAFGGYLDTKGFEPIGLQLAWLIKLTHVVAGLCLLFNRWVLWACASMILILITGILMVHGQHGWFVVGGGTNGVEFNLLLIAALAAIVLENKKN